MSTHYKVKVGERVVEVEGLSGLVRLVQTGELKADDPVWVPSTSQWHYARSIRQLREHFGKEKEQEKEREPEEPSGTGGEVVPFRRGKWSPEGKGIEVPVFAYDLDMEEPPAWRVTRVLFLLAGGLFALSLVYLYLYGYEAYLSRTLAQLDAEIPIERELDLPPALPGTTRAVVRSATTPITSATSAIATAPTAAPTPLFDEAVAREKVSSARVTKVMRPADLGEAIRADLLRIAVPLRSADCDVPRNSTRFVCTLDYATTDADAATRARHRFMILAMTGRRISELRMKVETIRFRSVTGAGKKAKVVETRVEPRVAIGLWEGSAGADAIDANAHP